MFGPGPHGGPAVAPEPYGHAGQVLMTTLEGVRLLLASIRHATSGKYGPRMPMSQEATGLVLAMLPKLASALDPAEFAEAVSFLDRRIGDARTVHGIDERRRLRHLPRKPGDRLPPRCPRCKCFQLVADVDARVVFCTHWGCQDRNGLPPVASMTTGPDGTPRLEWADGLIESAPDL